MTREYTISRVNYKPVKAHKDNSKEVERERYEFAKGFLRSYDNALKRIMRGERPEKGSFDKWLDNLIAEAKEMKENE